MRAVIAPLPWGLDHHAHAGLAAALPDGFEPAFARPPTNFDDAVAAVEEARAGAPAVVVGHSMAALVALHHALRFQGRVRALVLVGAPAGPGYQREGLWAAGHPKHAAWKEAAQRLRAGGDMRAYVEELTRMSLHRDEAWPLLAADIARAAVDRPRMDAFFREELPKLDVVSRLKGVNAPALVVTGREDALCTLRQAETLAAALPNARLEILDDCGHWPWYERPSEFRAALDGFLLSL